MTTEFMNDLGLPVRICQGGILNRNGRWRVPLPQVEHTHSGNHCHDEGKLTRRKAREIFQCWSGT